MEVLAKRAITPRVSGIPGTPFVSILLATYIPQPLTTYNCLTVVDIAGSPIDNVILGMHGDALKEEHL